MGRNQWLELRISTAIPGVHVSDVQLKHGQLESHANATALDDLELKAGEETRICIRGHDEAAFGTEGSLTFFKDEQRLGIYYWDCTPDDFANRSIWTRQAPAARVELEGGMLHAPALGVVHLRVLSA